MKKMKRMVSFLCVCAMVISTTIIPAVATDRTQTSFDQETVYDWDYALAMERGYLTHEDNLPAGITLNEDEIFIPAEVPNPIHNQAKEFLEAQKANEGLMRNNPLSDPWDYYTWEYLGVIQSDTVFDAILDAGGTLFFSALFTALGVPTELTFAYSVYDLTANTLEYFLTYGKVIGYYNRFMYTAEDPLDVPYVNYEITKFYSDSSRESQYYIGEHRAWEFAVAP